MWYVYNKWSARARTKVVRRKHIIQPIFHITYLYIDSLTDWIYVMDHLWVKVELMGPKLYKEIGGIIFDESYLPRISKPFYLNWQTFHHNNIAFWYWIFFCINGKSPLKDWLEHHVLMVVVLIMMSQYMCTRALSKSYIAMHHSVGARDLSANHTLRCILCLAMKAIWWSTPIVSWRFISR